MLLIIFIGVFLLIWQPATSDSENDIVNTKYGPIRGEKLTFEETNYTAFKGIPYAAPPIGNLRFKAPVPPEQWTEVLDATKFGNICLQPEKIDASSDDCLTLNVFTPSMDENNLKPVLVWIHGGAFVGMDGTDSFFGTHYLVQQDIVAVTINYRLGPLGFLATNSSDASGNWGLKDQVAALKWVQENIAKFGGDPKKVTIYGQSAGGISVHFHVLSPLSKGLFHSAISSSGTVASTVMRSAYHQEKYSSNLAKILGASENDIKDPARRVQFLREADPKAITMGARDILDEEDTSNPLMNTIPFFPVIESVDEEGAFITENPDKLLAEGKFNKVPLMLGVNDLEGGLSFHPEFNKNKTPEARREIEKNVCIFLPQSVKKEIMAKNECSLVSQEMRDVYFEGGSFADSMLNFIYLWGDVVFISNVHFAQKMHAKFADENNPLYNYYFTFDGRWNVFKILFNLQLPGAIHGEDFLYVFKPRMFTLPEFPPEVKTKDRMVSFITNFVKHGNPTPEVSELIPIKWEPATKEIPYTMFIGNDLKLEREFLTARMDFWDRMREMYVDGKSRGGISKRPSLGIVLYLCTIVLAARHFALKK